MKKTTMLCLLCLFMAMQTHAQRISHRFENVSMAEALRSLNKMQKDYTVNFIYDDLEDFRVTTTVKGKRAPEAIQQIIGFYPIRQTQDGRNIFVECTHKTAKHYEGRLIDEQGQPVEYANVALLSPRDSSLIGGGVSTESGVFVIPSEADHAILRVSCIGFKTLYHSATIGKVGTLNMKTEAINLKTVSVVKRRRLTKMTDDGLSYDMSANERAQDENTMQALSYVPMVEVNSKGDISVLGSHEYSIYINGRPDNMVATSPKAFLETIPAKNISRVEVITNPADKYGADVSRYIINIVLRTPAIEGFVTNVEAGATTQPTVNGSLLGMMKHKNVDVSLTYNYNLYGQRNQPYEMDYTEYDDNRQVKSQSRLDAVGDGNWHTHTIRAMMNLRLDSLNTIYADAHGLIKQSNMDGANIESDILPTPIVTSITDSKQRYTAGTAEGNIIYRNYFRDRKTSERFTLGYRFTYNPDIRHTTHHQREGLTAVSDYHQNTDGGMTEHSALASWRIRVASGHDIRLTAKDMYRHADTHSEIFQKGNDDVADVAMRYNNNIAEGKISYSGQMKSMSVSLAATLNKDNFKMILDDENGGGYSREHYYVMPSASLYWLVDKNNSLYLKYDASVKRPTVQMLNPFWSNPNSHLKSVGNPDLKAQFVHGASLAWYFNGITNLSLATRIDYQYSTDDILPMYHNEGNVFVSSYGNIGHSNTLALNFNISYNLHNWLSFSAYNNVGKRWLRSDALALSQNDWNYSSTLMAELMLPHHLRIGGQLGFYDNLPDVWTTNTLLTIYSFHATKSFFSGRMNVTLTANSPFNKYHDTTVITTLPQFRREQTNYIIARSFGLSLSYSFGNGKKVSVDRDRILQSSDQQTGVQ